MTIQELKEKKRDLEKEIADKLMKFETETGAKITSMDMDVMPRNYADIESNLFNVNIEAKLYIEVKL